MAKYLVRYEAAVLDDGFVTLTNGRISVQRLMGDEYKEVYSKEIRASARRNPNDRHRSDIGAILATGRALSSIGVRLQNIATRLVARNCEVKEVSRGDAKNRRRKGKFVLPH